MHDQRLVRETNSRLKFRNSPGLDVTIFAGENVPLQSSAIDELLRFLELQKTIDVLKRETDFFEETPEITKVALTPDFHKAAGVPVGSAVATKGFVIPAAIGNDVNCGMRLHVTSLKTEQVERHIDDLESTFRHAYFEGGRNIPMTRVQREALFRSGILGLLDTTPKTDNEGIWRLFHEHAERDLSHVEQNGSLIANNIFGLDDFLGTTEPSRDSQIGSIGGGNHFVEIQRVEKIFDSGTAHAWGLKVGMVTIMVHAGSVMIGHQCGEYFRDAIKNIYPSHMKHPRNGIFPLPTGERFQAVMKLFWDSLSNAANFAFANRLFLALMAINGLKKECGDLDCKLLYDAPHNMAWKSNSADADFIHRKGACPARGIMEMSKTPFAFHGEPVFVPGSMGASSFILAGQGNSESIWSASHGAGRKQSRGEALKGNEAEFKAFMDQFRIVTPMDFRRPDIRNRKDIMKKKLQDIKKEAPFAYKDIGPVIETLKMAEIARPVAELRPIMTVKG